VGVLDQTSAANRSRARDWVPLSHTAVINHDITDGSIRLLALLPNVLFDGEGAPGDALLAELLGVSVRTIVRRKDSLVDGKELQIRRRGPGHHDHLSLLREPITRHTRNQRHARIPEALIRDRALSDGALRLYAWMKILGYKTNSVVFGDAALATSLNITVSTVVLRRSELRDRGLISWEQPGQRRKLIIRLL
jgi:hypothetical protein